MKRLVVNFASFAIFWLALVYVPRDPYAGWNDVAYNEACPSGFKYLALGRSTADKLVCCRIFCLVGRGDEWRADQITGDAIRKILHQAAEVI